MIFRGKEKRQERRGNRDDWNEQQRRRGEGWQIAAALMLFIPGVGLLGAVPSFIYGAHLRRRARK